MPLTLPEWQEVDRRIDSEQIPDGLPLLDRLPPEFLESLTDAECAVLAYEPEAYLRPRQIVTPEGDWLTHVWMCGRGFGKSVAGAAWVITQVLANTADKPSDYVLVGPTYEDCEELQWKVIKEFLPPWVRWYERLAKHQVTFPDHGVTLYMHTAEDSQYRGPNLRGAWCDEPIKWANGKKLWGNLRLALRVKGEHPPRAVFTTTPPFELDWLLELCAERSTRVVRGEMIDNPTLDERSVRAYYEAAQGTVEGERELKGRVVLGVDGALFTLDVLEASRVQRAPMYFEKVIVSCDPAQSNRKDADPVGMVCAGVLNGHIYVLKSCSRRLSPDEWSTQAIQWAEQFEAGQYVVEPTGSGEYPRQTLNMQMRALDVPLKPIIDSKARGSKHDRAQPLSAYARKGRLHLVGRDHAELEKDLTTWHPGAPWSPGGLDALVHGASVLTNGWKQL
jgi:phage terminase large subunit-like protein